MAKKKVVSKTRRGNNEGSIYQRQDGLWVGMVSLGYDDNGKQKRKAIYGKTRIEASKKLAELTNRINSNNYEYVSQNTLSVLMKEWLMVFKKSQVSPRTFENNIARFKNHIEPKIGGMKLDEISTLTIQKMLNEMLEQDLSLDYVKKTKFLLGQFFEYAVDNKFVLTNPVHKVKVKSQEHKIYRKNEYKAIPVEIRKQFIESLNEHTFLKPFCYVMMFAGLRTGEALALEWQDIDFENKLLKVERGMTNVPKFDDNGKVISRQLVIGDTKTVCSKRTVPMPDILVEALKEYFNKQKQKQSKLGISFTDNDSFVFCNDEGNLRTYSGTKKIFYTFLKSHNLQKYHIHFHTLRHTFSNTLFEADQNPKVIQSLLGHKDVKTTITTYNSVDKSYFNKATDVFNEKYKVEDEKQTDFDNLSDDELMKQMRELEQQIAKRKKKQKDFEM